MNIQMSVMRTMGQMRGGGRGLVIMIMVRTRVTHLISPPANFHSLAAVYTGTGPL